MGKRSKRTEAMLYALEKAVEVGIYLYDFAYNPHHYTLGTPNISRYPLYKAVHGLKEKGWVDTTKVDGKILIKLTQKGKNHLAIERSLKDEKWDGKYRVVIFDIPERYRKIRDVLRWKLKSWGFKYLQKSLWVSKKEVEKPMREFIKELGVEKWVYVLVCTDMGSIPIFHDR